EPFRLILRLSCQRHQRPAEPKALLQTLHSIADQEADRSIERPRIQNPHQALFALGETENSSKTSKPCCNNRNSSRLSTQCRNWPGSGGGILLKRSRTYRFWVASIR